MNNLQNQLNSTATITNSERPSIRSVSFTKAGHFLPEKKVFIENNKKYKFSTKTKRTIYNAWQACKAKGMNIETFASNFTRKRLKNRTDDLINYITSLEKPSKSSVNIVKNVLAIPAGLRSKEEQQIIADSLI